MSTRRRADSVNDEGLDYEEKDKVEIVQNKDHKNSKSAQEHRRHMALFTVLQLIDDHVGQFDRPYDLQVALEDVVVSTPLEKTKQISNHTQFHDAKSLMEGFKDWCGAFDYNNRATLVNRVIKHGSQVLEDYEKFCLLSQQAHYGKLVKRKNKTFVQLRPNDAGRSRTPSVSPSPDDNEEDASVTTRDGRRAPTSRALTHMGFNNPSPSLLRQHTKTVGDERLIQTEHEEGSTRKRSADSFEDGDIDPLQERTKSLKFLNVPAEPHQSTSGQQPMPAHRPLLEARPQEVLQSSMCAFQDDRKRDHLMLEHARQMKKSEPDQNAVYGKTPKSFSPKDLSTVGVGHIPIRGAMNSLQDRAYHIARNILESLGIDIADASPPSFVRKPDMFLGKLYETIYQGSPWHRVASVMKLENDDNDPLKPWMILTALIGAFIFHDLLESKIPWPTARQNIMNLGPDAEYAAKIIGAGGYDLGRVLTSASLDKLEDDDFKRNVISMHASKLASDCKAAISPHINMLKTYLEEELPEVQSYQKWYAKMQSLFEEYLILKATLEAGQWSYWLSWYPKGTQFSRDMMQNEAISKNEGNQVVVMTLFPGVLVQQVEFESMRTRVITPAYVFTENMQSQSG